MTHLFGTKPRENAMRRIAAAILAACLMGVPAGPTAADGGAFAHRFTAISGEPLPLSAFAGQALLVVNTASLCGFTWQYGELQALWEQFRERGLVVLGVPSHDFGQELEAADEIKDFCEVNFDVDLPLTEPNAVRGPDAHPFFAHVVETLGDEAAPRWNFHKYLVAPDGAVVGAWPSRVDPRDPEIMAAIEAVLPY